MAALQQFVRRFGSVMTAYVFVAVGTWIIGMIILPQLYMVDYSLWTYDRTAISKIDQRIEGHYVTIHELQADVAALEGGRNERESGSFSPFESPKASDERLTSEERQARVAELQEAIEEERERIAQLEKQMSEPERQYGVHNYTYLFSNELHRSIFLKTIWATSLVTFAAFLLCYPVAYYLAQVAPSSRAALLILALIVPYWINEILRTFAWLMILSYNGILNTILQGAGLTSVPLDFLSGNAGVLLGLTYAYILFMVFPIYNTIGTLDRNQVEAAKDLGSPWWRVHWRIVIPHAKPGIAVGCIMTFMLVAGSYAVPQILSGPSSLWFTQIIYNWFFEGGDWNMGAAYSFVLLLICLIFILAMMRTFRVSLKDISR